jgi:hypothetical protein
MQYRRLLSVIVAGSLAMAGALSSAFAQPIPGASSSSAPDANDLFKQARELVAQQRYGEACPLFGAAAALRPGVGTFLNLGDCSEKIGKLASAQRAFLDAAELAHKRSDERETLARERAAALESRVGHLAIALDSGTDLAGLRIVLDGRVVERVTWASVPIDPGPHTIEASAPGYRARTSTFKADGPSTVARVAPLEPELSPTPQPAPLQMGPALDTEQRGNGTATQRTLALAAGGIGVAGVVVGSVFGLMSKSAHDDGNAHCQLGPGGNECDAQGVRSRDDAIRDGNIATAALVVGAAALAGGAVLWLTAPRAEATVAVVPLGVNGGAGAGVRGSW